MPSDAEQVLVPEASEDLHVAARRHTDELSARDWPGVRRVASSGDAAATALNVVTWANGQVDPLVKYLQERGLDARPMETEFEGEKGAEETGA